MNLRKHSILIWITVFALCMGIFEGSVVVYLRALYYPSGFNFPLIAMNNEIVLTELIRELASVIMLITVAAVSGKNLSQRFAWFIYSFAVWDIMYYAFLYFMLAWPESFFTWDILFLIPVLWTGPVITPIIISILMIMVALVIYHFNKKTEYNTRIKANEWILLIFGAIIIYISFISDYITFVSKKINEINADFSYTKKLIELSYQYTPNHFPWYVYTLGIIIIIIWLVIFYKRNKLLIK